jgi:hypothetical protein
MNWSLAPCWSIMETPAALNECSTARLISVSVVSCHSESDEPAYRPKLRAISGKRL